MKWGILATGTIAKKFADTITQMSSEGESLAAVGSRTLSGAEAFAQKYGIERAYGSYEQLAQDPDVEIIYVATPNSMHYENCRLCLEYGKHVLCEKPFTLHPEEAAELYRLAREKHLFIMEALWTRHLPIYRKIQGLVSGGAIGEVTKITSQYGFVTQGARKDRKFNSSLGGGALLDIGVYNLGFIQQTAGRSPESFVTEKVSINEYGTDDYSRICLTYPGSCSAVCIQTIGEELERRAVITGTKGSISLPDFQQAEQMVVTIDGKEPETIELPVDINGFEYEIREAGRCVREGRPASDIYTPEDSVALTELMYAIRMSWGMRFEGEV